MAPDVAALHAVDAGQDDEIGVRAEDVERIELDAAQPFERRTHAARATPQRTVEGMVRDERTSCLGAGKGEGRHAAAMVTGAVCSAIIPSAAQEAIGPRRGLNPPVYNTTFAFFSPVNADTGP